MSKPRVDKRSKVATKLIKQFKKEEKKVTKAKKITKKSKKDLKLNVPTTQKQQDNVPAVITNHSFEGVKRIDHLPLNEQIDQVFNPLHTITKTTVQDAVTDSTFIVSPKPAEPEKPKS